MHYISLYLWCNLLFAPFVGDAPNQRFIIYRNYNYHKYLRYVVFMLSWPGLVWFAWSVCVRCAYFFFLSLRNSFLIRYERKAIQPENIYYYHHHHQHVDLRIVGWTPLALLRSIKLNCFLLNHVFISADVAYCCDVLLMECFKQYIYNSIS